LYSAFSQLISFKKIQLPQIYTNEKKLFVNICVRLWQDIINSHQPQIFTNEHKLEKAFVKICVHLWQKAFVNICVHLWQKTFLNICVHLWLNNLLLMEEAKRTMILFLLPL